MDKPKLKEIFIYPIKSFGGESIKLANLKNNRILGDRIFGFKVSDNLIESTNLWENKSKFLTLSNTPFLAEFKSTWDPNLRLISIYRKNRLIINFNVDNNDLDLSKIIQLIKKLYNTNDIANKNYLDKDIVFVNGDQKNFYQDNQSGTITLHSTESIRSIETNLGIKISSDRFRSNLIVDGLDPWEEFSLIGKKISIGDSEFQIKDIVPRCVAINVNPNNGNIDLDLLKELMSLNSLFEPSFGVSLNHLGIGNSIKINDEIKLI